MLKIIENYSYLIIQNKQSVHHVHCSPLTMIRTQDFLTCLSWRHILYVLNILLVPLLRLQLLSKVCSLLSQQMYLHHLQKKTTSCLFLLLDQQVPGWLHPCFSGMFQSFLLLFRDTESCLSVDCTLQLPLLLLFCNYQCTVQSTVEYRWTEQLVRHDHDLHSNFRAMLDHIFQWHWDLRTRVWMLRGKFKIDFHFFIKLHCHLYHECLCLVWQLVV